MSNAIPITNKNTRILIVHHFVPLLCGYRCAPPTQHHNRGSRKVTTAAAPQGVGTTLYVYDQADHLLAEIEPPGTPLVSYVWKDDTPIAVILHPRGQQRANPAMALPADDVTVYLETDHLGTPRAAKDSAGRTVWRWESEAFGNSPAQTDPDGDGIKVEIPLRFPGQYYDAESGLHYNHHRIYDAAMGRYISSDPIGLEGGVNTYGYVGGNPLGYVDPEGLTERKFGAGSLTNNSGSPITASSDTQTTIIPPGSSSPPGVDWDFAWINCSCIKFRFHITVSSDGSISPGWPFSMPVEESYCSRIKEECCK